jgi:hypothetical protein
MPYSGSDHWRTPKQSFLALSIPHRGQAISTLLSWYKKRGMARRLRDNINQRIGLRYFFRIDHRLLVGFDRWV